MKKISSTLYKISVLSGIALGSFAITALAGTWTAPTATPPNGNTEAPLNVGYGSQTKQGGVWLKSLNDSNTVGTYGLVVENAPIKAMGGFIVETRTSDPANPETGRMWLLTQ